MQTNQSHSNVATHRFAGRSFYTLGLAAIAIALICSPGSQVANAAGGDLDPTFGNGGQVLTDLNHSTDLAYAVAIQSDGKLVVGGTSYKHNDYSGEDFVLARYNANGTL